MKLVILILLLAFCFVVDGHRFKSRRRNKGSSPRLGVSFPREFPFMEDLKVPAAEKLLTLDEFRSQVNGVWWTALYFIGTDGLSPGLARFASEVVQEKLSWTIQADGSVPRTTQFRPRIGDMCQEDGDDNFVVASDKFAIFRRTVDGITREDRFVSSNPQNYLIQYGCEDVSTIRNGKCDAAFVEYYSRTDPPNVIEYDKIAFDLACAFWLNIGDRRSRLIYQGRRCEDDALFPPTFEFNERIKIPPPMTREEFRRRVEGKPWNALIIIGADDIAPSLKPFITEVVHEQLTWETRPDDSLFRQFVYRPRLGVPCVDVGNDNAFRWSSDTVAVMERTRDGITRKDWFFGREGYLIQVICNDIRDLEGEPLTCGPENAVAELYTDMSTPDKIRWDRVAEDFAKIMLNLDDRRARWMFVGDQCPNRLM